MRLKCSCGRRATEQGAANYRSFLHGGMLRRVVVAMAATVAFALAVAPSAAAWDSVPPISSHAAITAAAIDQLLADPGEPAAFKVWLIDIGYEGGVVVLGREVGATGTGAAGNSG